MKLVTKLLVLSMMVLGTSGWGDVLHYPEFVKHMEEIGKYNEDLDHGQADKRYNLENKKSLLQQINLLRKALEDSSSWMNANRRKEKEWMMKWMKRSFSTSQLRRQ